MRIRCQFDTRASRDQVFRAYTDFSDRRLTVWRDTLRPDAYELLEQTERSALVREGSLRMSVVLRYQWDPPSTVRWSIVESNFCKSGTGRLDVRSLDGGGARADITIEEHGGKGLLGPVLLGLKGLLGPLILPRTSKRALDRFADEDPEKNAD